MVAPNIGQTGAPRSSLLDNQWANREPSVCQSARFTAFMRVFIIELICNSVSPRPRDLWIIRSVLLPGTERDLSWTWLEEPKWNVSLKLESRAGTGQYVLFFLCQLTKLERTLMLGLNSWGGLSCHFRCQGHPWQWGGPDWTGLVPDQDWPGGGSTSHHHSATTFVFRPGKVSHQDNSSHWQ